MIRAVGKGDFGKTKSWLESLMNGDIYSDLDQYGRLGVDALSKATPVDTGLTAGSWRYRIIEGKSPSIVWYNTNKISNGTPVVILLHYGHGTGTGGYVYGRDFINPAMRYVFDMISLAVWRRVNQR